MANTNDVICLFDCAQLLGYLFRTLHRQLARRNVIDRSSLADNDTASVRVSKISSGRLLGVANPPWFLQLPP